MKNDSEWESARKYFYAVRAQYVGLIGKPGVSVTFALEHVFVPLQQRYESGERTDYLHDEMMAVK